MIVLPDVDFYIHDATNRQAAWLHACQLVEKYYLAQQSTYLLFDSSSDLSFFDQLLWTYKDVSFIPHAPLTLNSDPRQAVLLGTDPSHEIPVEILFNFTSKVPGFSTACVKIVDFVFMDPEVQQAARLRYTAYRQAGHKINNYKL